jgi:NitT/TauT family transport system permease protein
MLGDRMTLAKGVAVEGPLRTIRRVLGAAGLPVLGATVVIGLWWLAVIVFDIKTFILPSPADIVEAFTAQHEELLREVKPTLVESVEGFGLATVVGLAIALAVTTSSRLYRMFYPLIVAVNAIPKLALAPLTMAWFGLGQTSRVALVFMVCFFPIVVSSVAGFTTTPAELTDLAHSLSATRWQTFRKVRLPGALPQIFVGLKVAVGLAVIGAVISEFTGVPEGLGFAVNDYSGQGRTPEAFAALILLSVLSVSLYYLLVAVERLALPWARRTTG